MSLPPSTTHFVHPPAICKLSKDQILYLLEKAKEKTLSNLSELFVASIAQALSLTQVPCVLWGHYLHNVHGVPSIIGVAIPLSRNF